MFGMFTIVNGHPLILQIFLSGYASRSNLRNGGDGADSVMDLKRELRQKQQNVEDDETPTTSSTSTSQGSSSGASSEQGESIDRQEDVNHDYQTMDRSAL